MSSGQFSGVPRRCPHKRKNVRRGLKAVWRLFLKKRYVGILLVSGLVTALAATGTLIISSESARRAETVTLGTRDLTPDMRSALNEQLDDFMSLNPRIKIAEPASGSTPDVAFVSVKPTSSDSVVRPWHVTGFHFFFRLTTLSGFEDAWQRRLVQPLSANELDAKEFAEILGLGKEAGKTGISVVRNSDAEKALSMYAGLLRLDMAPYLTEYPDIVSALDDMNRGKILFLFADDSFAFFVQENTRTLFRSFAFPGSRGGDDSFFIGKGIWLVLNGSQKSLKSQKGPQALIRYLTSPGVARKLGSELPGEFFSWQPEERNKSLPEVRGPNHVLGL